MGNNYMTDDAHAIMDVLNEGHVLKVTSTDVLENYNLGGDVLLQADIPDASTFYDESLEAMCEILTDLDLETASNSIRNDWYGGFIDMYYLTDLGGYFCVIGNR